MLKHKFFACLEKFPINGFKKMKNRTIFTGLSRSMIAITCIMLLQAELSAWAEDPDFGGSGSSGNTRGGGTRGNCPALDPSLKPLTALIPKLKAGQATGKAIETVSARPTIWIYVPYTAPTAKRITFILKTESGEKVYQLGLPVPTRSGIVSITVPNEQPPLEVGKSYQWKYLISCSSNGDAPEEVIAQIKRVSLDPALQKQLAAAKSPLEQSRYYTKAGVWYETLTVLGNALKQKPNDPVLRKEWSTLMNYTTVNLGDFAAQPFLP